jgi:tRNA splicing ligase
MLHVQEFLMNGESLEQLETQFGIVATKHESLPLVILNYRMIGSQKNHPITNECRGLVLETGTWKIIAKSFNRFFNLGELANTPDKFNWNNFRCESKEDGSIILCFNYHGLWHINTRGSFGCGIVNKSSKTWKNLFSEACPDEKLKNFCREYTYVFELVGPINHVVRKYPKSEVYLIGMFSQERELPQETLDAHANRFELKRPEIYNFTSITDIENFLQNHPQDTFEGVVICDDKFNRWKIKNSRYLSLHKMRGNGDNIYAPKTLLPFIMRGDTREIATYFPEVKETIQRYEKLINTEFLNLLGVWVESRHIPDQKEFALYVVPRTQFSGVLFTARKTGQAVADLWQQSEEKILKFLEQHS